MNFVDTNYFLRFLLKDDPIQHEIAKNLFLQAARGKADLATTLVVLFEIYWVLTSYYKYDKQAISETLLKLLNLNFSLEERETFIQALYLFRNSSLDLEDCYNLSFAKQRQVKEFKTFDEKLKKVFARESN